MDSNTLIFINFLLSILSGVISGVFAALITHHILKKLIFSVAYKIQA